MRWQMSSAEWRPFCLGLNVLIPFLHRIMKVILYRNNHIYTPNWYEVKNHQICFWKSRTHRLEISNIGDIDAIDDLIWYNIIGQIDNALF